MAQDQSPSTVIDMTAAPLVPGTGMGARSSATKKKAPGKAVTRQPTLMETIISQTVYNIRRSDSLLRRIQGLTGGSSEDLQFLDGLYTRYDEKFCPPNKVVTSVADFTETMGGLLNCAEPRNLAHIAQTSALKHVSSWIRLAQQVADHLPVSFFNSPLVDDYTAWAGLGESDADELGVARGTPSVIVFLHSLALTEIRLKALMDYLSSSLIDPISYTAPEFVSRARRNPEADDNETLEG